MKTETFDQLIARFRQLKRRQKAAYARAYYWEHTEEIKAAKRAKYWNDRPASIARVERYAVLHRQEKAYYYHLYYLRHREKMLKDDRRRKQQRRAQGR